MLTNPYNPSGSRWLDNHKISGRISQDDFYWFKGKFPFGCTGIVDKVVANLFKKLIDELRKIDRTEPFDPAWSVDHASYRILEDVFERLTVMERRAFGEYSVGGPVVTQHESGGVNGVRSEVQPPEVVGPVKEGKPKTRKRSRKGAKEKEKQRRVSDGAVGKT
jgi:hypothetical protein